MEQNTSTEVILEDLREELRLEALALDEQKKSLIEEQQKLKEFLTEYPTKGVDEEGFPQQDYPHVEVAQAKFRIGEIQYELKDIESLVQKKLSLYFSMDENDDNLM